MGYSVMQAAALKSTLVLAAAWLCTVILRRRSAAARHLVWTWAAAAAVLMPVLSVLLPVWRVPLVPRFLPEPIGLVFYATVSGASALSSAAEGQALERSFWHFDFLVPVWFAGTALAFVQMLAASAAIRRIRRGARRFNENGLCAGLAHAVGIRRPIQVLQTAAGSMPMTFGLLRATIFLPSEAARWSEERLGMVLLHELAHVRRYDVAMHWLARAALSLYWWNPLAWVAWRGFLKERERAADDLVLSTGARASAYAGHLLEVARAMRPVPVVSWGAVAMARRPQLEERLSAILDSSVRRRTPGRLGMAICALLATATLVPLAAVKAQETTTPSAANERRLAGNLLSLGTAAILKKDLPRALGYFERAGRADPGDAAPVMWMAVASEQQHKAAEADKLYQRALSMQDPKSPGAAVTTRLYSRFLREQGRAKEANEFEAGAAALQRSHAAQNRPRTPGGVYRIGPGVVAPKLLSKSEPEYSNEARAAKLAGTVVLYIEIAPDGRPHHARVMQSLGLGLDDRAVQAIEGWRFQPGLKDGQPVTVAATVEINFRLI